jgi:geranylgeranyl pyrophosphate synthase
MSWIIEFTKGYHMRVTKENSLPDKFQQYLSETRQIINLELSNLLSSISQMRLHPQIEYALLSEGKRLRPLLIILAAQSVGGDRSKVMPLALAFELVHNATLVHDDIIDGDKLRRGVPALYRKWSVNDAILAGDAMIALAINLAASFGAEVMKAVSQSALELCNGEYMDVSSSLNTTTEEEYFLKIKKKSASLFRAAMYCGALAGGGSSFEVESLAAFGENFGIAYQLRDDLLDLKLAGGFIPKDLKSGRVTLPLIHLYRVSDFSEREMLENNLRILMRGSQTANNDAVERIFRSLVAAGSFTHCEQKITEYIQRSIASVTPLKDTEFKAYLIQMAKSLTP